MEQAGLWLWAGVAAFTAMLAVFTPVVVLMARHSLRLRRLREIVDFGQRFGMSHRGDAEPPPTTRRGAVRQGQISSFEYAGRKYTVDLDTPDDAEVKQKLNNLDFDDGRVYEYYEKQGLWTQTSTRRLLCSAIPYMIVCLFGFLAAHVAAATAFAACGSTAALQCPTGLGAYGPILTVGAVGFLGAYLFSLQMLTRSVQSFDLSAITFLRVCAHLLLASVLVVLAYRLSPSLAELAAPVGAAKDALSATPAAAPAPSPAAGSLSWQWYGAAFVLGFVPYAGLQFIFMKVSSWLPAFKRMDETYIAHARSVPLDYVDGIDFLTRYRLEEANIFEMQNLACANPILLYVETPFTIYQTIDWVAQAQLCTIVGTERFLILRQFGVRTIFDLERAVLSMQSTAGVRRLVGGILLMTNAGLSGLSEGRGAVFADLEPGREARRLDLAGFMARAVEFLAFPGPSAPAAGAPAAADAAAAADDSGLFLLVRMMLDDLHVHRLREIWMRVDDQLGGGSLGLRDTILSATEREVQEQ